jgi:hypothetical protein
MDFVPKRKCCLFILLLISNILIKAQNNTNSPYSIFGIGELENKGIGASTGMGGTGIGMQSNHSLNYANPASYSGIDSISFIYELCTSGKISVFTTSTITQVDKTANFKKLDLGFRVAPFWALGLGVAPFSNVGYDILSTAPISGTQIQVTTSTVGTGGITQLFFINSISIGKNLAIGINASYLFGSTNLTQTLASAGFSGAPSIQSKTSYHNFYGTYGLQYSNSFNKISYTFGAIYAPHNYLKSQNSAVNTIGIDTIRSNLSQTGAFLLPNIYGVGFSLCKNNQLTIALDYKLQQWAKVNTADFNPIINGTIEYINSNQFSLGLQYAPKKRFSTSYFDRMVYQFGANYMNSYLKINNQLLNLYSLSCGIGLPIRNNNSFFNVAFEYGKSGVTSNGAIQENYFMVHLNIIMHDYWFMRSKYN